MLYRLVSPVKRKTSSKVQFVQRIPADVRGRAAGLKLAVRIGAETVPVTITSKTAAVRVSLRTSDPSLAKVRQAEVAGFFETLWQTLRTDAPVTLSHRDATALAGELYRAWAEERPSPRTYTSVTLGRDGKWHFDDDSELVDPEAWGSAVDHLESVAATNDPARAEAAVGPLIDRLLLSRGILQIDPFSREMLLKEAVKALRDGMKARQRNAAGDYSPDPTAQRFPVWERDRASEATTGGVGGAGASRLSFEALLEDWWREAKKAGRTVSTYESYRNTLRRLRTFLRHDDVAKVTAADIIAFKDHRLAEGISTKTVNDSDIAGLRAVFGWAVVNQRLGSNPAEKVKAVRAKSVTSRSKGFTDEEAQAILRHSLAYENSRESAKLVAAKRWVPWLCAYTGARVGELVQLRKTDVRQSGGEWIITITPEAGTVKDKEAREVVLHGHLVELGFPAFVAGSSEGYLFLTPAPSGEIRGRWQATKNRLREFAREVVTDKGVAPQHGWRHLFKTIGREAGIEDRGGSANLHSGLSGLSA
jgi:integrase